MEVCGVERDSKGRVVDRDCVRDCSSFTRDCTQDSRDDDVVSISFVGIFALISISISAAILGSEWLIILVVYVYKINYSFEDREDRSINDLFCL